MQPTTPRNARETFDALFHRLQHTVWARAYQVLKNQADAEDVAQLVWLKVAHALPGFRWDCAIESWLYRITTNLAFSHLRTQRRQIRNLTLNTSIDAARDVVEPSSGPLDQLLRKERTALGGQRLRQLSPDLRTAVVAYYDHGPTRAAATLGMPIGTLKSRAFRGLALVRQVDV